MTIRVALVTLLVAVLLAPPVIAQAPQDSTLDNLIHAADYHTAPLGSLGAVVERGPGPVDMILVTGFGLGASVFDGFMKRNETRYHMLAVTLPGFEGTKAPPMPPPGTSYGANTWTNAAIGAVSALIDERKLDRPILVGHFINGTQVAMQLALAHPERVAGVVLLSGTPRFEPAATTQWWPKNLTLEQKIKAVDQFSAPRWFKTVTRATWVKGNFIGPDYAADSTLGARAADQANDAALPVLIRYLCEFHASDLWPALETFPTPLLVMQPDFTAAVAADSTRNYIQGYIEEPSRGVFDKRTDVRMVYLKNSGILVMDDQPADVDREIGAFVEQVRKGR